MLPMPRTRRRLTFELTRVRKRAKPPVALRVQRRVSPQHLAFTYGRKLRVFG